MGKKIRYLVHYFLLSFLTGWCITACNNDSDFISVDNVYFTEPLNFKHEISYNFKGDIISGIDQVETLMPVCCTISKHRDIDVVFAIDESLVNDFNKDRGFMYHFLRTAKILNPKISIKAGELISLDSIKVEYTDMSQITDGSQHYVLPITIKEIKEGSKVLTNITNRTLYLMYNSLQNMVGLSSEYFTTKPEILEATGGRVPVSIICEFPKKYMMNNVTVEITPVLRWKGGEAKSAPVLFQAENVIGKGRVVSYNGGSYMIEANFNFVDAMSLSYLYLDFVITEGSKKYTVPSVKIADGVIHTAELTD